MQLFSCSSTTTLITDLNQGNVCILCSARVLACKPASQLPLFAREGAYRFVFLDWIHENSSKPRALKKQFTREACQNAAQNRRCTCAHDTPAEQVPSSSTELWLNPPSIHPTSCTRLGNRADSKLHDALDAISPVSSNSDITEFRRAWSFVYRARGFQFGASVNSIYQNILIVHTCASRSRCPVFSRSVAPKSLRTAATHASNCRNHFEIRERTGP